MTNKKKATTKKRQSTKGPGKAIRNETENELPIVGVDQDDTEKAHGWKGDSIACGYCAMKAVYIFFGLEKNKKTDDADLWGRLGVDKQPVPPFDFPLKDKIDKYMKTVFSDKLIGALPMDICEVLWEDGFDYETTTNYEEFIGVMPIYLDMGYPALVLTTLGNPLAHWVVVSGITEDKICVVNSLDPSAEPDWKHIDDFQKVFNCAIMITGRGHSRKPRLHNYIANYMSGAKMGALALGKAWIF